MSKELDLIIVGSVGLDSIITTRESRENILGGSASFACAASSFFSRTGMVGVVGTDFPASYRALYEQFNIDLEGLQVQEGKTFHWSGEYEENMDNRHTLHTELNVFEHFSPHLPDSYCDVDYLFLGNIAPELQLHVLEQVRNPKFVLVDTMDLWINIANDALKEVVSKVTMLTLNESEARLFTGEHDLLSAAKALLELGPQYVLVKKGANGSMLIARDGSIFMIPAYPVMELHDPTGAGDTFAGGLMGYLAEVDRHDQAAIREAIVRGTVVASFGVEKFSVERYQSLKKPELGARIDEFLEMVRV